MPSLFAQRFDEVAAPMLREWLGATVTIQRGAITTDGVTAMWEQKERVEQRQSITTTVIDRLWQIAKTAYTFSGVASEPKTADRIIDENGTEWEVLPASVPSSVSYSGDYDWSISTKRVKA